MTSFTTENLEAWNKSWQCMKRHQRIRQCYDHSIPFYNYFATIVPVSWYSISISSSAHNQWCSISPLSLLSFSQLHTIVEPAYFVCSSNFGSQFFILPLLSSHDWSRFFFSCKFEQISLVEAFDRTVGLHSTWNEIAHQLMYFKSFYHSIYPEWVVFITILTCELLNHLTRARSNYISIDSRLP